MTGPKIGSREAALRKAQKELAGLSYTPQSAKFLAEILIVLSEGTLPNWTESMRVFDRISGQKPSWVVSGRRA